MAFKNEHLKQAVLGEYGISNIEQGIANVEVRFLAALGMTV